MLKNIPVASQGWWAVQVPRGTACIFPRLFCLPQTWKLTEQRLEIAYWTFTKCSIFKTVLSVTESTVPTIYYFLIFILVLIIHRSINACQECIKTLLWNSLEKCKLFFFFFVISLHLLFSVFRSQKSEGLLCLAGISHNKIR